MTLVVATLIKNPFYYLVDLIATRKHQAIAQHVSASICTNDLECMARDILEATSPCIRGLVEGLDNLFGQKTTEKEHYEWESDVEGWRRGLSNDLAHILCTIYEWEDPFKNL